MDAIGDGGLHPESQARAQAARTDAVIAAVQLMNRVKSDSSVMGDDRPADLCQDIAATERLVKATMSDALQNRRRIDHARLLRLALFANEWLQFKRYLCGVAFQEHLARQQAEEFRHRTIGFAREISRDVKGTTLTYGSPGIGRFPWKRLFIGTGAFIALVLGWNLYRTRRPSHHHENEHEHDHEYEHEEEAHAAGPHQSPA